MTTYYDYLRHRVQSTPLSSQAQLEHLIHSERNILWQRIATNPAYDEQNRLAALAAFDEAASQIFSEQDGRYGQPAMPSVLTGANVRPGAQQQQPEEYDEEPARGRSILRDVILFVLGIAVGLAAAYFAGGALGLKLSRAAPDNPVGVESVTASQRSFKFVRREPSPLEGELKVEYAGGARTGSYTCEVDATYKQILEYVRFNETCETVTFKFLPLVELWQNFNYLEGYMVFSTEITSPAGAHWEGSASVYFTIDGTT